MSAKNLTSVGAKDEPENIAYQRVAPWNNRRQPVPVMCAVNGTQYGIFSFRSSINKEQAVACYSKALRAKRDKKTTKLALARCYQQ